MLRRSNKSAIIVTIVVAFSALNIFSIPGAVKADNFDELCTIVGTEIDDVLVGTSGDDVICGLGGDDVINGETGNDRLIGGDGNDQILGDDGNDYAEGGLGADKLFGGNGFDALVGGTDNDVLIGGASSDSLDGGDGIDYCEDDKQDSAISSCFFDEGDPKLISVAISTGIIDTSVNSAVMIFRVRALDIGTGVKQINFGIRLKDKTKYWSIGSSSNSEPCGTGMLPTDPDGITSLITGCRVGGDQFDGIYEVRVLIPRQSPKGRYVLVVGSVEDNAGNTTTISQAELLAKKFAVSFLQVGAGDITQPKIVSFRMLTKTVNTNSSSAIINFVVRVKDAGSGLSHLSARFSSKEGSHRTAWVHMDSPSESLSCNGKVAPDPVAEREYSSCLLSGTEFDATFNVKIRLPQYSPKGVYRLNFLYAADKAQNVTQIENKNPWNKIGFTQIGLGDTKSPKISEISVLTPTVNTSTSVQVTKIRVKFSDDVSGVGKLEILFLPLNSLNHMWFAFDAKNQKCTQYHETAEAGGSCLISGTLKSGIIELTSSLQAHAPATEYYLHQVSITDYAGNGGGCWRDSCQESDQVGFSVEKIQISNTTS